MTERVLSELVIVAYSWMRAWYWRGRPVERCMRVSSFRKLIREPVVYVMLIGAASCLMNGYLAAAYAPTIVGCVMSTLYLSGVYLVVRLFWQLLPPLRPDMLQPRHLAAMERMGYEVVLDEQLRIAGFKMIRNHDFFYVAFGLSDTHWNGVRNDDLTTHVPGFLSRMSSRTPMEEARRLELLDRRAKLLYNGVLSKGGLRAE